MMGVSPCCTLRLIARLWFAEMPRGGHSGGWVWYPNPIMTEAKWMMCFVALLALAGCEEKLDDAACLKLRSEAFETINKAHTCDSDSDCVASEWPGCERPVNTRHKTQIDAKRKVFETGKCTDEPKNCRKPPEVYCKQGLCVFREKPGQTNLAAK